MEDQNGVPEQRLKGGQGGKLKEARKGSQKQ